MCVPRQGYVYLAQGIKSVVSVPVLASNRINDPSTGEEILRNGAADMVTMARGLLADPDLPNKAQEGKSHLIYHCVACNQGCFDSIFQGRPATCLVNPIAGREAEFKSRPAPEPKKVLVIGGGPAGMKAACTASERGHNVTLIEKEDRLGGQLLLNRLIPGREEMETVAVDLINNLKAGKLEIILGKEADERLIGEISPDAVVVATGARPVLPDIPGVDGQNVVQAWDLLDGRAGTGEKVVIVGGNAVGLETALYLANQGTLSAGALHFLMANRAESIETLTELLNKGIKEVTVVEMTKKAGQDIGLTTRWTVTGELKRLGVQVMTETRAVGITPEGLEIERKGSIVLLASDSIVIAAGSRSENALADKLKDLSAEILVVGDAKTPRNALEAIREGFEAALSL